MATLRERLIRLLRTFAVLMAMVAVWGCESQNHSSEVDGHIDRLRESAERGLQSLGIAQEEVSEVASTELKKVFNFEYKLLRFAGSASVESIEAYLNQVGQDRWDCFQVVPLDSQLVAICKRAPQTPLRYIPRMLP